MAGKSWMWTEALEMLQSAERLQRQFFQVGDAQRQGGCWEPPVDIYEKGDEFWIYVALPGVADHQIEVAVEGNTLVVRGERRLAPAARGAAIHRLEIPYGRFERRVSLPPERYQVLQRVLDGGCLVLGLRRLG